MSEENLSIEVVASWANNPLASEDLTDRGLRIGPDADCAMLLPSSVMARGYDLIVKNERGFTLRIPSAAQVTVDGAEVGIEGGVRTVALTKGVIANVRLGDFQFFVRAGEKVEAPESPRRSVAWMRWLAVAAVLHGIVLAMFAMSPPNAQALNVDALQDDTRYISMSLDGMATPTPPPVSTPAHGETGGSNSAAGGDAGGGETVATPSEAGSPGPRRDRGRLQPVFVPNAQNVNQLGALAVLTGDALSFGDGSSPYTAGSAVDGPGGLANAQLLGLPRGPGWGMLDMNGHGVGTCDPRTQECGTGLIGVGQLETHGDPGGPGTGHDIGWREPPTRVPPRIRTPQADTLGALSREQVRRTVRRHINEVRFCYEQQLQTRPDLEGRVAIRFIISPTGAVQSTGVASNTVGSSQVASCVQQAVSRWTFPAAPGVTGVTYPFVMQSSR